MFNIGPGELVVILLLALILLGPEKLPEVARTLGKGMKELRRASDDLRHTVEEELYRAEAQAEKTPLTLRPAGSLPPAGAQPLAAPPAIEAPPAQPPAAAPATDGAAAPPIAKA